MWLSPARSGPSLVPSGLCESSSSAHPARHTAFRAFCPSRQHSDCTAATATSGAPGHLRKQRFAKTRSGAAAPFASVGCSVHGRLRGPGPGQLPGSHHGGGHVAGPPAGAAAGPRNCFWSCWRSSRRRRCRWCEGGVSRTGSEKSDAARTTWSGPATRHWESGSL